MTDLHDQYTEIIALFKKLGVDAKHPRLHNAVASRKPWDSGHYSGYHEDDARAILNDWLEGKLLRIPDQEFFIQSAWSRDSEPIWQASHVDYCDFMDGDPDKLTAILEALRALTTTEEK